jgi:hypothetical protein
MLRLTPHDRGLAVEKCGKPGACVPAVALRTWIWIVNIMLPGEMLKDVVPSDSGNDVTPPPAPEQENARILIDLRILVVCDFLLVPAPIQLSALQMDQSHFVNLIAEAPQKDELVRRQK